MSWPDGDVTPLSTRDGSGESAGTGVTLISDGL